MTAAAKQVASRRSAAAARPAVDLTSRITSDILDQGPRPTCVAFAVAAAHEAERPGFKAAVEPLWWRLVEWGLADSRGTTLQSAGQALTHSGHCEADLWPYNDAIGSQSEPPPAAAGPPPWTCADLTLVTIAHDSVEDAIEDMLADGHPVLLVLEVTDEFLWPEADGYIPVPAVTAPAAGYHAVLVTGAWTDPTHGRVLLIRNSWGEYWAAGGHGLLPPEYLVDFGGVAASLDA
jgi:hypothetical protein